MHLENLSLIYFKNYEELNLNFSAQINCFVGENGGGKTNLLDAIHYLSLTKSAFNAIDVQNIQHEQPFFLVKGTFSSFEKQYTIQCSLKSGQKKIIRNNKKTYEKISDHIGLFPLILIAPDDTNIIREGSEMRRKFFDSIISQLDSVYLSNLIKYNHILRQRNNLLKQFAERNFLDKDLLEQYDMQLLKFGEAIFVKRQQFIKDYLPVFIKHYQNLSSSKEQVSLQYKADFSCQNKENLFEESLRKDLALQRTTIGIHKDDFIFEIEGFPLKKFGSQGQQKSFLIALKLAQFDVIRSAKGYKPILLLDDVFDKLDDQRIQKLMEMVAGHSFGQLFVTDARPERTARIFESIEAEIKVFRIKKGVAMEQTV